jgi:hypothetical protein
MAATVILVCALALDATAQQPPAGRGRGRGSPPQPQQQQGVEYLHGTWSFSWTGRESPLTIGPRSGTTTFTRRSATVLDIQTDGKADDGDEAFRETGTAEWDDATKVLRFTETLAGGAELAGEGDWSSPLSIRYESQPLTIGGETLRVRRTYAILSAHSFSVTEEMSTGDGPWVRLGPALEEGR